MTKYSIVIGTYNHLEDCLKPCLESIKKYTDLSTCEVIVVSNGSTDGTGDYVRSLGEPFRLIEFPDPLGYAKANNIGAMYASGEYLVLLNNDTYLFEQEKNTWLNMLEKPFSDPMVGITGPIKQKRPEIDKPFIIFFCAMIRKKLFDKIGLNEDYEIGGGEDIEFCIEAEKLGYKTVQVPEGPTETKDGRVIGGFPIFHLGEATVMGYSNWEDTFQSNVNKVALKYNVKQITFPDSLKNSNPEIFEEIINRNVYDISYKEIKDKLIFDIGANTGIFSVLCAELQARYIVAVEPTRTTFSKLEDNTLPYSNIQLLNRAVTSNTGDELKIYGKVNEDSGHNNIYSGTEISETVKTISFDDLVEEYKYLSKTGSILKIDVEGAEYDILLDCKDETIKHFDAIHIEIHSVAHPTRKGFNLIEDRLSSLGFVCEKFHPIYLFENGVPKQTLPVRVDKWIKQPFVNIIMPVYNAEMTLERSIESIVDQTYKNWKLWLVNDGSTDSSVNIVAKFAGHPQIELISQNNRGVSEARNTALKYIKDDAFIAYCDSDDIWAPNHLEVSIKTLLEGYDFTYCNPYLLSDSGRQMYTNIVWYDKFDAYNLKKANFIYISSVVHRGKIGLFDSKLDSLEDYDMWLRAVEKGYKFKQHPEKTITYIIKENNMSSKGSNVLEAVKQKNASFFKTPIKLHLGCGDQILPGYINCDLHAPQAQEKFDAAKVPYPDNSVDEIMAYHLIEHFDFQQGQEVLKEWYRVLKPGGRLHLETPDLLNTCRRFVEGDENFRVILYGHLFAWPWLPGQAHKFLFTEQQLAAQLSWAGFHSMKRLPPDSIYAQAGNPQDLYLNMEAYK